MECLEFRRRCDAEPQSSNPEFAAHAAGCASCAKYAERARQLDERILEALRIDVPLGESAAGGGERAAAGSSQVARGSPDHVARGAPDRITRRSFGIAASFAIALGAGVAALLVPGPEDSPENSSGDLPGAALASEVVAHIQNEPAALEADAAAIGSEALRKLLARHSIRIDDTLGAVSYASTCVFRGSLVPHLVVQSEAGPITVMVLADEPLDAMTPIEAGGFSGRIVPAEHGSVAIVGRQQAIVPATEERIVNAITWEA